MAALTCPAFTDTGGTGQYWVGSYEEEGAAVAAPTNFPLLAYVLGPMTRQQASSSPDSKCFLAGPFATQGDAQSWADSFNTNPSTVQAGSGLSASTGTATAGAGAPSVPGFSSIENAATAFYNAVTNYYMWRSLGWVVLGIALMLAGAWLWIGPKNLPVPVPI